MVISPPPDALSRHLAPGTLRRVSGGYLLACMGSGVLIGAVLFGSSAATGFLPSGNTLPIMSALFTLIYISVVISVVFIIPLSLLPATLFVLWSEAGRKRKWMTHLGAGVVISGCGLLVFECLPNGKEISRDPIILISVLTGGILGGTIYWLIAGRHAGNWRIDAIPDPLDSDAGAL
jgi:hypothetical protein